MTTSRVLGSQGQRETDLASEVSFHPARELSLSSLSSFHDHHQWLSSSLGKNQVGDVRAGGGSDGRVQARLGVEGCASITIILITSDHGCCDLTNLIVAFDL